MQMFAFSRTEAGIRRMQRQARLPAPEPLQPLYDEIQKLKDRIAELEGKPEVVYQPRPSLHRIVERACKVFKLTQLEIRSNRRHKRIVMARQFVFYWGARRTTLSLPRIGRLMGGRDHTTVMHGRDVYPVKRAKMGRHLREVR